MKPIQAMILNIAVFVPVLAQDACIRVPQDDGANKEFLALPRRHGEALPKVPELRRF